MREGGSIDTCLVSWVEKYVSTLGVEVKREVCEVQRVWRR